jgi:hypothetical protein
MKEEIVRMSNNIGSLVLFLKNRPLWVEHINENIPKETINLPLSEKIYYYVNDIKEVLICDCGRNRSFIGFKNGHRTSCNKKECYVNKRKKTCIERYGVDNPKKSKEILLTEKENILKKWNGNHYMYNESIREKFNATMTKNWGVEWAQQSKIINEKSLKTFNENENRDQIIEIRSLKLKNKSLEEKNEIQKKKKNTLINNWGSIDNYYKYFSDKVMENSMKKYSVKHHLSHPDIIKKRIETYTETKISKLKESLTDNLKFLSRCFNTNMTDYYFNLLCINCDKEFSITRQLLVLRKSQGKEICLNCNPILHGKSQMEGEVYEFIIENYTGEVIRNCKNLISKELDIYLPEYKIAFEFNGLYWHSDIYKGKNFHLDKTDECLGKGLSLVHIWEDDWIHKGDIVRSIILNKLGKSKKIMARNCQISEISNSVCREFLETNHIQGFIGSKVKLGLFNGGELVSVMSFGNLRTSLGQSSKEDEWELLRFCNKLNLVVVGGASKLLSYFVKRNSSKKIISYSDVSRSNGDMYSKLGFKFSHRSSPNYYWIVDGVRRHRFGFRKDVLVREGFDPNKTESDIMNERGYLRIWDCGSSKWELEIIQSL